MICAKCKNDNPDGARYCCSCGRLLSAVPRKKSRAGNGTGYAYKRGSTWSVRVTTGWDVDPDTLRLVRHYRTRGGFAKKSDALRYAETLKNGPSVSSSSSLDKIYSLWSESYAGRVSSSTMAGYAAAYKHYADISFRPASSIRPMDLQSCIDGCGSGKRTKQMMKVIAGLLFKYAMDNGIVQSNPAANLYTGKDEQKTRDPFSDIELQRIRDAVGTVPYADYILCMCYLGLRPGEMLRLEKSCVNTDQWFLTGGGKTEAGRDRIIPIHKSIRQIILSRLSADGDLLFPRLSDGARLTDGYFRDRCFAPAMEALNISGKVPYSCRHTYSNLLKNAKGDSGDKARLMGHTDYAFTQKQYQSSSLDDLRKIVNSIK